MPAFRIKRWLTPEEFREVIKIADYKGYERGAGSLFEFNIEKALRNKYSLEDVVNLLKELAINIDDSLIDELRKLYNKLAVRVKWDYSTGWVIVSIPRSLRFQLIDLLKKYGLRRIYYDDEYLSYKLIPYRLHDFIEDLRQKIEVTIVDENNLLKDKVLPRKLELRNIVLRPYQEEALREWLNHGSRGIIALPTGSGKTIIGIAAITAVNKRTLIITFTREQMFQWKESIYKYTNIEPGYVGVIYSGEKRIAPITITTYQSGFRNIKQLSPLYDLLIVDEVHHLPADKFRYIAIHSIAKYRIGLSATVVREDGRHEELFPLLGGIVYHKTPAELAVQGYLARHRIITVKVRLSKEEKEEFEGLRKLYRSLAGYKTFKEVLKAALKGDQRAKKALRIHNRMRSILSASKAKIEKAVEIALREYRKGNKIIIFTQYVDQAEEIAERLNAYLLTGEIPPEKRRKTLREFREASSGILVVTTVGDEGLDIPDANVGIIVSGTGSRGQFIQRLGRLLRPKKNSKEAILYEIILANTPEEYQARKRKRNSLDFYS